MSKQEIKDEISRVLDGFSDKALTELLHFLNDLDSKRNAEISIHPFLERILKEDNELLHKLAQ